ncbi:MAG TPA: hypothetical protein EYP31_01830 [Roseibacterium sp.]|nr:hypothetical protein [Roseibacterium sp.]
MKTIGIWMLAPIRPVRSIRLAGLAGLVGLMLSGCSQGIPAGSGIGGDFKRQYAVSRNALESGNFDKAARGYGRLLQKAGPYEPRIRLEYSHALLRANHFQAAAAQARALVAAQTGSSRSAALAVQGTAEHELGLITPGPDGRTLLESAQSALAEALKAHPEMDRGGNLKARKARLDKQLSG